MLDTNSDAGTRTVLGQMSVYTLAEFPYVEYSWTCDGALYSTDGTLSSTSLFCGVVARNLGSEHTPFAIAVAQLGLSHGGYTNSLVKTYTKTRSW
jgi:hypothetical protein